MIKSHKKTGVDIGLENRYNHFILRTYHKRMKKQGKGGAVLFSKSFEANWVQNTLRTRAMTQKQTWNRCGYVRRQMTKNNKGMGTFLIQFWVLRQIFFFNSNNNWVTSKSTAKNVSKISPNFQMQKIYITLSCFAKYDQQDIVMTPFILLHILIGNSISLKPHASLETCTFTRLTPYLHG